MIVSSCQKDNNRTLKKEQSVRAYRKFAEQLAYQAGGIIMLNFGLNIKKDWKGDGTPLTATDTAVNDLVLEAVAIAYPNHAALAEEGNLNKKQAEYTWVCDPLDGTIPFSHGIPICVFSLALVYRGTPIVGVVYDPFMDRLFSAENGKGAYLNESHIRVSEKDSLAQGLVHIGYARNGINLRDTIDTLICSKKAIPINFASNVYAGSLVAAGEFLGAIFTGKSPWDVAALKIIVEEAGGRVTDLFGNEQRYDREIRGAIISNDHVHDQLLELVHTHVQQ